MFNRLRAVWTESYSAEAWGRAIRKGDYLKQAMQKSCSPTEFEPTATALPAHCSTT